MSQIMQPLTEARLSVILYRYDPVELPAMDDLFAALGRFYQEITGRVLAVSSTAQGPFAAYLTDGGAASPATAAGGSKRDVMLLLEQAFDRARRPADADSPVPPGSEIIRAMAATAAHCQADVQIHYKSDRERKSVLLTRMEAATVSANLAR